ncbi:MAG: hypothetical protein JWP88_783 [Flaviaesturariibacter sp.]|nr:hypothetical protein [Flaviaesturariibacter sp.]
MIFAICCSSLVATVSFAQKSNAVHQAITHPARQTEAGKADVYIQEKQVISEGGEKTVANQKRHNKGGICSKACSQKKKASNS